MPVIKKKAQPEKTVAVSPTSTYRVPAASSTVATSNKGKSVTVATSKTPVVDLRQSSYNAMNSPAPTAHAGAPAVDPRAAFFGSVPQPLPQSFLPPISPKEAFFGTAQPQSQSLDTGMSQATPQPAQPVQAQPLSEQVTGQNQPLIGQNGGGAGQNLLPTTQPAQSQQAQLPQHQTFIENAFEAVQNRFKEEMYVSLGISIDGWQPPPGTTYSNQMAIPGPGAFEKVAAQYVAKEAALSTAAKNSVKSAANLEKIGQKIASVEGIKQVAGNTDEAAGILKGATEAVGQATKNPKTDFLIISKISKLAKDLWRPLAIGGAAFSLYYGKYAVSQNGKTQIDDDATAFSKSFVKDGQALIDAGYPELASEIYKCAEDVKTGLDSGDFDSIFGGKAKGLKALNDCKDRLSDGLARVEKDKADKAKADLAAAQIKAAEAQIKATKAAADAVQVEKDKLLEQRSYNEAQKLEQRSYNEQSLAEQRRYNEAQSAADEKARLFDEATATETAQGSTLSFGLLGTGGAVEFVNKDKASQVYYGKAYDELTPEQRALLNLLKKE